VLHLSDIWFIAIAVLWAGHFVLEGFDFGGSLIPAVLWGLAFGNVLHGIPLNAAHNYTGIFFSLQNPYSLLGGVTTLTLFTLNGALFLGLKTTDDLRRRANALAWKVGLVAGAGFLAWTGAAEPEKAGR
jgi:cytochrome d ubiquinol oxidase subunit II